jgi:hypothetical protein
VFSWLRSLMYWISRKKISVYCTNQMYIISYIQVLNALLWRVLVQAYHLLGAQCARFKTGSWHVVLLEDGKLLLKHARVTCLTLVCK